LSKAHLKSFKELFDLHYKAIRNFIYYKTGDISLAEDLAQEAFVKLWERMDEVQLKTAKSYLYTIANNLTLNHFKHQKVVLQHQKNYTGSGFTSSSPQYELELKEFDQALQKAIDDLPEKLRVTFLMNRIDKMKYQEIASALEISVKGVQKRIKKALDEINEKIGYRL
jgi:RNA polymerase sigma-70 factor (ECF subfamily)